MNFKKICSVGLSLLVTVPTIVSANTYETPTILNQEATLMDVTVPLSLPIDVDSQGTVTVADNVEVVNNSNGPIVIKSVSILPKDDWSISEFDKDYSGERLGLKEFGFKVEGIEASVGSPINLTDATIDGGSSKSITYNASVAPQKEGISGSNIADVVFTIGWSEASKKWIYRPDLADKWETGLAAMPVAARYLKGNVIGDKVYVVGMGSYSTYSYEPSNDKWEKCIGSMSIGRQESTSDVIDGKLYVIGGLKLEGNMFSKPTNAVEVYDPTNGVWETKSSMSVMRYCLTSTVVDGKIYCIGGVSSSGNPLGTVEVYDPVTDSWETKTSMPTHRYGLMSFAIGRYIYCVGGCDASYSSIKTVEVYDTVEDKWYTKNDFPINIYYASACTVGDNAYIIGGFKTSPVVYKYDKDTDSWDEQTSMPTGRGMLATSQINGRIYCIGGNNSNNDGRNTVEVYDTGWRYE